MQTIIDKSQLYNHSDFSGRLILPYGYEYITLYPGGDKLHYYLLDKDNNVIFSGNDLRPSPLYPAIDCVEAVVSGLSFLTLQEGATDNEYFSNYTPEQIAFRDSFECEQINCLINDFEMYENEKDEDAKEEYRKGYEYFINNYLQTIG